MDTNLAIDRNDSWRTLPPPIVLTPAEAKRVAGGIGTPAHKTIHFTIVTPGHETEYIKHELENVGLSHFARHEDQDS
jgi:hypothetical protein